MFIILVAAGLLAGAVKALHEAGLWNQLQTVVFDLSHVLPVDTPLGVILSGMFGYNDTPTVSELLAWVLYLLPALFLFCAAASLPPALRAHFALPLKSPFTNLKKITDGKTFPVQVVRSGLAAVHAGGMR
jgi:high-affinity Fe2+/Pb2+ permease